MAVGSQASPPSTNTERINPKTVEQAVRSLLKWRNSKSQHEKPKLFDQDDEFFYLILTLKKIPQKDRVNPYKILLPHSLLSEISELCLIIDDRPKSNLAKDDAQKKIESENIPVSKVLKLSKLKSDYRPFEAKRKLCDSYDMFFADKGVIPLLPRLLGKHFYKKKKIPVPLDLKHKNWKEQIEKACSSALFFLGRGTCSVVRVAKMSMEKDEIIENVVAAINGVAEVVPKKWGNVRSLHLKLLGSLALPVYQTVPDMKLKIEGIRAIEDGLDEKVEEGEKDQIVTKKKGRIHEVRYMDSNIGEELNEDDDLDSQDDANNEEDGENQEMVSGVLVDKKRKKANKMDKNKDGVIGRKDGFSAKAMKDNLIKQNKNELPLEDTEPGKKRKKRGLVKSEGRDMTVKAKKTTEAA